MRSHSVEETAAMNEQVAFDTTLETVEMRTVYNDTMMELAEKDGNITLLDADLMGCNGTRVFCQKYPDRVVNCGIQEANMIGVAAGLSLWGRIPFAHSFGTFATRRAYDQIFVSAAYAGLNVKIIGSDPGITASLNGGTHMPFEDMGIIRGIPSATVLEPADSVVLAALLREMAGAYGVHYLRLLRKNAVKIYRPGTAFTIGKANVLKEGRDVTLIASGYCLAEAIKACQTLAEQGIDAGLVDMFTWKPLDDEAVINAARQTGAIVTAENHNVVNGLGAAVCEALCRNHPVPVETVGVQDEFGEVGPVDYLAERFGLTAKHIAAAAHKAIARKKGMLR